MPEPVMIWAEREGVRIITVLATEWIVVRLDCAIAPQLALLVAIVLAQAVQRFDETGSAEAIGRR
jgi:hypothetical protein